MRDPNQLAISLPGYVTAMRSQPRRRYADPWEDWPNRNTGRSDPVVYALWADSHNEGVLYVGQTVDLGKRLAEHDAAAGWGTKFEKVTRRTITLATGKQMHDIATVAIEK